MPFSFLIPQSPARANFTIIMKPTPYAIVLLSMSIICTLPACKPEEKTAESAASSQAPADPSPTTPDTPETAVRKIAQLQNDMAAVMESITDTATAEAALPRITLLAEEFAKIGKSMKTINSDMSPELKTKLEGIMQPALERMQAAITKSMPIITKDPDLAKRFQEAMAKMNAE